MEGSDKGWQEAGTRRQAFYTNLGPGPYRFRVMACNNDGVWNEAGTAVSFRIVPAFYQTLWFQTLCCATGLALLWFLYLSRLKQATAQVHSRLEGRRAERERIARELHDTLLQSFQGLMLRLQVVGELLPPGKAKDQLEQSLERADQAIAEGRSAVHNLRSTAGDLAVALRGAADELVCEGSPAFRLTVEGAARDLDPMVREEVNRIACECLRNAFKHARAKCILAELTYGERTFRLRVRDDGCGIPPDVQRSGRAGHYGLSGIRERARQTGCRLDIWSSEGSGTEIDLTAPGSIAYAKSARTFRLPLFRKKAGVRS
jgi:signal transduction histidine kinase